jgi:hypothetical protein
MVKLAVLAVALVMAACASMAHAGSLRNEGVVKDDQLLVNRGEDRDLGKTTMKSGNKLPKVPGSGPGRVLEGVVEDDQLRGEDRRDLRARNPRAAPTKKAGSQ